MCETMSAARPRQVHMPLIRTERAQREQRAHGVAAISRDAQGPSRAWRSRLRQGAQKITGIEGCSSHSRITETGFIAKSTCLSVISRDADGQVNMRVNFSPGLRESWSGS